MPRPPKLRQHKQIFEINAGPPHPRRVIEKIEGETGGPAVVLGNQALVEGIGAESIAQQALLGRRHRVRRPLKGRQCANKFENLRGIRRGCSPNHGLHIPILVCDTRHTRPRARRTTMQIVIHAAQGFGRRGTAACGPASSFTIAGGSAAQGAQWELRATPLLCRVLGWI